jgi:Inner membrane protein YgaP-like, transmembrane domain
MNFLHFMNTRVGRGIRVVAGVVLIAAGIAIGGTLGVVLAVFALLPIATGVFGVCPVNPLFGESMKACAVPSPRGRHSSHA